MAAVVGFLVASGVTIAIGWVAVGRDQVLSRDPNFDAGELGRRFVTILGGLAGFAVTGMVLLVTLGRNLPDSSSTSYTTMLAMFLVAYIGFLAVSLLFANVVNTDVTTPIDIPATVFAGAAVFLYFTIGIAWFALQPLFATFGLHRLADLSSLLLLVASIVSYGLTASYLYRTGLASGRLAMAIPVLAAGGAVAYAVLAAALRLRSPDATLALTVTGFVLGTPAYGVLTALPAMTRHEGLAQRLASRTPFALYAFAQSSVVLIGFLLLSMRGLA